MRTADLATIRHEALSTLRMVDPRLLWLVIADQRNGYPSGGYDAVSGSGYGSSSTEAAALTPDRAAAALHDLERVMVTLQRAVAELGHLHAMWTAPPRLALCAHCHEPTGDRDRTHCRRCAEWVARHDRFPTVEELVGAVESGRRGGRARAAVLTAERRSEIAHRAASARWAS